MFPGITISWFIYTPTSKSNLPKFLNPLTKSTQNPISSIKHPLSYPISSNTTKINKKPPNSFKNLNSISSKTTLTDPSFFLINKHFLRYAFSIQLYTIYSISQHLPTRGGALKLSHYPLSKRPISSNLTLKFNLALYPTNLPTKPSKLKFTLKIINLLHRFYITNSICNNKNSPYD